PFRWVPLPIHLREEPGSALGVLRATADHREGPVTLLLFHFGSIWHVQLRESTAESTAFETQLGWTPERTRGTTLRCVSVLRLGEDLEVAGLDSPGFLHWSRLCRVDARLMVTAALSAAPLGGYLAVTIIRSGVVAAVAHNRIDWLHAG